MIYLVDAAWLRLSEGGALMRYYLTEGRGRNLQDANSALSLYLANSPWRYWLAGHTLMQTFLVDRDPAHPRLAGSATATLNAGQAGMRISTDIITPARFWAAHPMVAPPSLQLRLLLSYHYFKDHDLDTLIPKKFTPPYPQIFADSGAFSAYTQGATIRWQDYAAWLKRYRHWFVTMANLDVIGDPHGTARHQTALEDAGLPVLPVFHTSESWDILERMVERYRYIALGGMVAYSRDWKTRLMPWLIQCFKRAEGKAGFHGFGCTTWEVIKALPWRSVDSSSWGQGFRYGQVPLFDWKRGRFQQCQLGDPKSVGKVAPLIRALGFEPADFAIRARNTRAHNCGIAALSYCLAAAWLQRRWGSHHRGQQYLVEANTDYNTTGPAAQVLYLVDCESRGTDTGMGAQAVSACAQSSAIYCAESFAGCNDSTYAATTDTVVAAHHPTSGVTAKVSQSPAAHEVIQQVKGQHADYSHL